MSDSRLLSSFNTSTPGWMRRMRAHLPRLQRGRAPNNRSLVDEDGLWTDNASVYTVSTVVAGGDYSYYDDDDFSQRPSLSRRASLSTLCTLTPEALQPRQPQGPSGTTGEKPKKANVGPYPSPSAEFHKVLLAAEKGDAQSQVAIGNRYRHAQGIPRDDKKALAWFSRAAEQGDAEGQFMVGHMYFCGFGVKKNDKLSVEWFRKAAEQGHAAGEYQLGNSYLYGQGIERDYDTSLYWREKSANQGYPYAQASLGTMYMLGYPFGVDLDRAIYWYGKAADQDFADTKTTLKELLKQKAKRNKK
ncbi:hypothetical protein DFQ27_004956 [Actinomortierella ambigua]|uniref:Sel1 repeat family protein n=1 Tax=Actinomortierella ambigua TaxID=1343610 RepID=A0A9P6Q021_9FUNG|nr:hypothetical protein DFQ27_004956 [Actinomortierella ambigua]